jgi:ATP-dependent exoDNAse (exonuclease V) beta subunit
MAETREKAKSSTPGELLEAIIKCTGYDTLVQDADDGNERWAFVQELINLAKEPPQDIDETIQDRVGLEALGSFLEGISLLTSAESKEEEGGDTVKLMTMHASKGLEFNSVFISGVEEGLIPFVRNGDSEDDQDEEVRLFYVGITRAKRKLMLCHARERRRFGQSAQPARRSFLLDSISAMLTGSKKPERSVSIPSTSRGKATSRTSRGKSKTDWGARVAVDLPPPTRKREGTPRDRIEKSRDLIAKVTGSDALLPLPLRKAKAVNANIKDSSTLSSENATSGPKSKRAPRRRKAE